MNDIPYINQASGSACHVFEAESFSVVSGANLGDHLTGPYELCPGDVYRFAQEATPYQLMFDRPYAHNQTPVAPPKMKVSLGSEVGAAGDIVSVDAELTLIAPDGDTAKLLLLCLHGNNDPAPRYYVLLLGAIEPKVPYTLVTIGDAPSQVRMRDVASVAFARGTMITQADGRPAPIESLAVGDRILTRENGPQPIRWIGHRTLRAIGPYAPVVIKKGALNNDSDLIVSQHQRLFIYQRSDTLLTETAEVLVKAGHLVDDVDIVLRKGGFVDYYHLILDRHEIIYAESIPTESLMVNERSLNKLEPGLAKELGEKLPGLSHRPHFGTEANRKLLRAMGPAALRRTSSKA